MLQKLVIAMLLALIIGAVGIGIASIIPSNTDTAADNNVVVVNANTNGTGNQNINTNPDVTPNANANMTDTAGTPQQIQQVQAQDTVGDVWEGEGTITAMDDFGMTLSFTDGTSAYVELGPPTYWKEQGVALAEGETVQVAGWNNGEQIHARLVTTSNGELALRTEASQPLWSGGANNTAGQNGTHDSTQELTFQVAAEDWLTIEGTITIVTNGTVTMQTADGTVFALQMGQPNFWQSQGVTLAVGDAIEALGFWQSGQFMVGDITKAATGEHIILRDPNGRQLWGGPGRNGNANGNTNHSTTAQTTATGN